MNITDGQHNQLLLDMRALISDYARDEKGFPSNDDFKKALDISKTTVIKYKKIIMDQDSKSLLELFGYQRALHVKDTIKVMNENVKFYKDIRDDTNQPVSFRMDAAKNLEVTQLKIAHVLYDAEEYLYDTYSVKIIPADKNILTGRKRQGSNYLEDSTKDGLLLTPV